MLSSVLPPLPANATGAEFDIYAQYARSRVQHLMWLIVLHWHRSGELDDAWIATSDNLADAAEMVVNGADDEALSAAFARLSKTLTDWWNAELSRPRRVDSVSGKARLSTKTPVESDHVEAGK